MKVRQQDKPIIMMILSNVGRGGENCKDLAGKYSVQAICNVARRYNGCTFKSKTTAYTIHYCPPDAGSSWKSTQPGIKNPRTGLSERIPAQVYVVAKDRTRTMKG